MDGVEHAAAEAAALVPLDEEDEEELDDGWGGSSTSSMWRETMADATDGRLAGFRWTIGYETGTQH